MLGTIWILYSLLLPTWYVLMISCCFLISPSDFFASFSLVLYWFRLAASFSFWIAASFFLHLQLRNIPSFGFLLLLVSPLWLRIWGMGFLLLLWFFGCGVLTDAQGCLFWGIQFAFHPYLTMKTWSKIAFLGFYHLCYSYYLNCWCGGLLRPLLLAENWSWNGSPLLLLEYDDCWRVWVWL